MQLLFVVCGAFNAAAQEHPFLSHFSLSEGFGTVHLDWTMIAGNTCQGIQILRSLDLLTFTQVGEIPGLCGDISQPINYSWTDEHPIELTKLYYRLELGTNGPSSIQAIDLQQVIGRRSVVFPSPMRDLGVLILRVPPGQRLDVRLYDQQGRTLQVLSGIPGPRVPLDLTGVPAGMIIFEAVTDRGEQFSGRFLLH